VSSSPDLQVPERKDPDRHVPAPWKRALALTTVFLVTLLGAASAVTELGVLSSDIARSLLVATLLTGLLYFVIRVWQFYYVVKVRELRAQLAGEADKLTLATSGHRRYLEAIERISDREKPLFSETLEVTVWIGADDDSDRIVEKRVTTPRPLVTHRTMRPVVPTSHEKIIRLDDIGFRVQRSDGRITVLPLHEEVNKLRVWLVFDSALTARTEWQVDYRPRGLWKPLREQGWDYLAWNDRLPAATPSAFTNFKVVFKFPETDQRPGVMERQGYGTLADPVHLADGTWEVAWHDERPDGRRYVWDVTQAPHGGGNPQRR
jgi:hypothetical protein